MLNQPQHIMILRNLPPASMVPFDRCTRMVGVDDHLIEIVNADFTET